MWEDIKKKERKNRRRHKENEKASVKHGARRQRERIRTTKKEKIPVMVRRSGSKGKWENGMKKVREKRKDDRKRTYR